MVRFDGKLVRFAQDCGGTYGKAVHVFAIDKIDEREYEESPLTKTPVIAASGYGWNRHGMHNVDAHRRADGTWFACVDGYRKYATIRWEY